MAFLSVSNVSIKGVAVCVPPKIEKNRDIPFYTPKEAEDVIIKTGIESRYIVDNGITGSDLCTKAFNKLIEELGWDIDSIDAIVYVTQTPDYRTPPTVFVMHDILNLSEDCMCIDINHGCPGWVVGLSSLASLMSHGTIKRAILFDGDTVTMHVSKASRESRPLFGDAGSATALEYDNNASPMEFYIGTDSKDGGSLFMKNGGYRYPYTLETFKNELNRIDGHIADNEEMDGMSVFSFGISKVPKSIKKFCEYFQIDFNNVNKVLLHQANAFMLNKIVKKLKIDSAKVPTSLRNYGNTTSVSIPLTLVSQCNNEYSSQRMDTLGCGFGTGLAMANFHFITKNIVCPDVIIY